MRTEVLGGQLLDITAEASRDSCVETAEKINLFKTTAYTIERSLRIGAAIAGASAELVEAYRSFGRNIGVAFQLRDDRLGVFGDPKATGRPAGDDLCEGKRAVLVGQALNLYRESAPEEARFIDERLGAISSVADIDELRNLIADSGAIDTVECEIDRLTSRALSTIESADLPTTLRENLIAMGVCATARQHQTRCCVVTPTASPTRAPSDSLRLRRAVTRPYKGIKPRLTIIDTGLSGLTAALYAIADGYDVTVVERESSVDGRCASEPVTVDIDGQTFTAVFDTSATVWTMPSFVNDALAAVGLYARDVDPGFSVSPITPTYRAESAIRGRLGAFSNEDMMADGLVRSGAPDSTVAGYRGLHTWLQSLSNACLDNFISRSFDRVTDLLTGSGVLRDLTTLLRLGASGALEPKIRAFLGDTDLVRVFSFQALYAGVPLAKARAVYDCTLHMDTSMGIYYPHSSAFGSSMGVVSELLAEVICRVGGTINLGVDVTGLKLDEAGFVSVIITAIDERPTDAVIATTDLSVVQSWLHNATTSAAGSSSERRSLRSVVKRAGARRLFPVRSSPSAVMAHGLISVPETATWPRRYHPISFGEKWNETFEEISLPRHGELVPDPSLLIIWPIMNALERTVTDANGVQWEPVSMLAPCPNLQPVNLIRSRISGSYVTKLAAELERRGLTGISTKWRVSRIDTPQHWQERDMSAGSPFGLAHLSRQTGPFRPRNFFPKMPENLMLAGSTMTPGVGVSTAMVSG